MKVILSHNGLSYGVNLNHPLDITIPMGAGGRHPRCFFAPDILISPVVGEGFIGDIEQGGLVNFKNVTINPHGTGTHTECCGHITSGPYTIERALRDHHHISALITVSPSQTEVGDLVIMPQDIIHKLHAYENISALVIRTEPNEGAKKIRDYSGTNPIYIHHSTIQEIIRHNIDHLIIDLPSVDRESDGGALKGHKTFWDIEYDNEPYAYKTITELVYVDNEIEDGLYMCAIYPLRWITDASPSRVVLYQMVLESHPKSLNYE